MVVAWPGILKTVAEELARGISTGLTLAAAVPKCPEVVVPTCPSCPAISFDGLAGIWTGRCSGDVVLTWWSFLLAVIFSAVAGFIFGQFRWRWSGIGEAAATTPTAWKPLRLALPTGGVWRDGLAAGQ